MKIESAKDLEVYQVAYALAMDCGYIDNDDHQHLVDTNRSIGRMLGAMIRNPASFLISPL